MYFANQEEILNHDLCCLYNVDIVTIKVKYLIFIRRLFTLLTPKYGNCWEIESEYRKAIHCQKLDLSLP